MEREAPMHEARTMRIVWDDAQKEVTLRGLYDLERICAHRARYALNRRRSMESQTGRAMFAMDARYWIRRGHDMRAHQAEMMRVIMVAVREATFEGVPWRDM